jgi:pimeloyl-ACP methyl ester carboxylesterase
MSWRQRIWHGWLNRPYSLNKAIDVGRPYDVPVVFLHGIGRSAAAWELTAKQIDDTMSIRMIAFDLLGFGASPKPTDIRYDVDDHARSVIKSIDKMKLRQSVVLVGHSMGCLVAVRVARLRPDLVRHLVLYEMPLYAGLPEKRMYKMRLNIYFKLYEHIIAFKPIFSGTGKGRAQKLAEKVAGFTLSDDTWKPFIRSLKHTIMEQKTNLDLKELQLPMDIIYGSRDRLVIRGRTREIFGEDVLHVTAHTIKENHRISPKASAFLIERIEAAIELSLVNS